MTDETDSENEIAALKRRVAKLEGEVQQLIRAAQQSAKAVNYLQSVAPRQIIRR